MQFSVRFKFLLAVLLCLVMVMASGTHRLSQLEAKAFEQEVHNRTSLVSEFGEATQAYVNESLREATEAHSSGFIVEAMSAPYVTRNVFEKLNRALPDYVYRQPTLDPLNPRDLPDEFEGGMIESFRQDPTLKELSGYRVKNGKEQFYIAKPVEVKASCLKCHGLPAIAPPEIRERYGDQNGFFWPLGEVVSALTIYVPTTDLRAKQAAAAQTTLWTFLLLTLSILVSVSCLFEGLINRRIVRLGSALQHQANSPSSTLRIQDKSSDELGRLSQEFNLMADALKTSYNTLESQVSDRTQELTRALKELKRTQVQLVQAEKMSSLGQMVAGIAHEINNPVNFIQGNLEFTQDYAQTLLALVEQFQKEVPAEQLSPTLRTDLENADIAFLSKDLSQLVTSMKKGSARIQNIVTELRNFARLDEAIEKTVDLHEGIDSTLLVINKRLAATPNRAAIRLTKDYGTLPLIKCYPSHLNQAILHLLTNAIDAVANLTDRQPTIQIKTALVGGDCQIAISDNGMGIPSDIRSAIFDPFFTTKEVGSGTGLGLAISYQIIVETHGGKLLCDSTPGQGTTMTILLPS